jgi:hypothetical protein
MGVPAKGLSSVYRNHINDVVTFLKKHHGSNYMVWNLSEKKYKTEKFDNQVRSVETLENRIRKSKANAFCWSPE